MKELIEEKDKSLSQTRNALGKLREKVYTSEMNAATAKKSEINVNVTAGNVILLLQKRIKDAKRTLKELKEETTQEKTQKPLEYHRNNSKLKFSFN